MWHFSHDVPSEKISRIKPDVVNIDIKKILVPQTACENPQGSLFDSPFNCIRREGNREIWTKKNTVPYHKHELKSFHQKTLHCKMSVERIISIQISYQSSSWYQEMKTISHRCVIIISKDVQKKWFRHTFRQEASFKTKTKGTAYHASRPDWAIHHCYNYLVYIKLMDNNFKCKLRLIHLTNSVVLFSV